jgi:hypothetical protein
VCTSVGAELCEFNSESRAPARALPAQPGPICVGQPNQNVCRRAGYASDYPYTFENICVASTSGHPRTRRHARRRTPTVIKANIDQQNHPRLDTTR